MKSIAELEREGLFSSNYKHNQEVKFHNREDATWWKLTNPRYESAYIVQQEFWKKHHVLKSIPNIERDLLNLALHNANIKKHKASGYVSHNIPLKLNYSTSGHAVISCQNYNKSNPPMTKLYRGIQWIGYDSHNVPNGFMSYFGTTLHVTKEGVYTIYMSADDKGWLYINGKEIGSTSSISASWHQASEFKVNLKKGLYGITVSVKNDCPKCQSGPMISGMISNVFYNNLLFSSFLCTNPSSLALFIKDPSGKIVLYTGTDWKASSSVIDYKSLPAISSALKAAEMKKKIELKKAAMEKSIIDKREALAKQAALHKAKLVKQASIRKAALEENVGWTTSEHRVPSVKHNGSLSEHEISKKSTCVNLNSFGLGCNKSKTNVIKSSVKKSVNEYHNLSGQGESKYFNKSGSSSVNNQLYTNTTGEGEPVVSSNSNIVSNKSSSLKSTLATTSGHSFMDDIKKYWWIGLLAVGHIL